LIRAGAGPASTRAAVLTLGTGTLSIMLGALPVFLLGALAVFVRDDLHFGETGLGAAASLYYLAAAVSTAPGGWLANRWGARGAMAVAATATALSMLGMAALATRWGHLAAFMALAGCAHGLAMPATNLGLAQGIPPGRRGAAFGFKQSSGPLATLLAGASVPAVALTVGWRWAFMATGLAALPLILRGLTGPRVEQVPVVGRRPEVPFGPLVLLATAAACAVVAGSAFASFYVQSVVAGGASPATAGTLLAFGSVLGAVARFGWGAVGDYCRPSAYFVVLGSMLGVGAGAFVLLAVSRSTAMIAVATLLVFCLGWGWQGLFNFAVVASVPAAPASATGVTSTGIFAGGVVGPLAFGAVAERLSYLHAWLGAGAAMALGAVLFTVGGRWLRHRLTRQQAAGRDRPEHPSTEPPEGTARRSGSAGQDHQHIN
jgi:MFS family permease